MSEKQKFVCVSVLDDCRPPRPRRHALIRAKGEKDTCNANVIAVFDSIDDGKRFCNAHGISLDAENDKFKLIPYFTIESHTPDAETIERWKREQREEEMQRREQINEFLKQRKNERKEQK